MEIRRDVEAAERRIRPHIRWTPLEPSRWLSGEGDFDVRLKYEHQQITGSFKLRGALSKLTMLTEQELARGVVAASTGNHAAGVVYAAAQLGTHADIFAPETALPAKLESARAGGATIRLVGQDCVEAELAARAFAAESNRVYVSPYNDELVIAGQGTLGLELAEAFEGLDTVYVAVGGGGLAAGLGGYLKSLGPDVEVVGCSPVNSAIMAASVQAGRLVHGESLPTLSDGTAGDVEEGSITYPLCRDCIDRFVLVSEEEIAEALRGLRAAHDQIVEGAAGVAIAAFLQIRGQTRDEACDRTGGRKVAILLCGGNLSPEARQAVFG